VQQVSRVDEKMRLLVQESHDRLTKINKKKRINPHQPQNKRLLSFVGTTGKIKIILKKEESNGKRTAHLSTLHADAAHLTSASSRTNNWRDRVANSTIAIFRSMSDFCGNLSSKQRGKKHSKFHISNQIEIDFLQKK
jgi:hypothetical protein